MQSRTSVASLVLVLEQRNLKKGPWGPGPYIVEAKMLKSYILASCSISVQSKGREVTVVLELQVCKEASYGGEEEGEDYRAGGEHLCPVSQA